MSETLEDITINIRNETGSNIYTDAGCFTTGAQWYKTENLSDSTNQTPLATGQSRSYSGKTAYNCQATNQLFVGVDLWGADAKPMSLADSYYAYDTTTGKVLDSKMSNSVYYTATWTGTTLNITVSATPESPMKKYWWVWLIVAAVLAAIIVTAIVLARRRRMVGK